MFYDFSTTRIEASLPSHPQRTDLKTRATVKSEHEDEPVTTMPPYDTTHPSYILVTTVSGEALHNYQKLSDAEIVSKCVSTLRLIFPKENVPEPMQSVVSRWGADPFAQMSYSFAAVGSSGDDYDALAEEVDDTIFFGGEVRWSYVYSELKLALW